EGGGGHGRSGPGPHPPHPPPAGGLRRRVQPGISPRGVGHRGHPPPRPDRDRGAEPASGDDAAGAVRAAGAADDHHRRALGGDDQVRVELVPGHQDLVHQCDRQPLRAGRRRRDPGGEGDGAGPPDRPRVPPARPRLRRLLLPQGHRLAGPDGGEPRVRLPAAPLGGGGEPGAGPAVRRARAQGPRPAGGPGDRRAGSRVQAQDRRHAGGPERRGDHRAPGGRGPGPRLRPRRHGQRPGPAAGGRRVLPVLLRGRRGRRRDRDRDRVERVQAPEPGAAPGRDAAPLDLRRPQHVRARAHAEAGVRVPLDRAQAGPPRLNIVRVLVTGGAGFIGSHLSEFLLGQGCEVVCLDNLLTGTTDNIDHLRSERFTFIKHDVTNYIYVAGPLDYVLHFASPASPVDYQQLPIPTLKVGALGTHKALGLAKSKGARFLLASTSEVYGDPLVHPQREDYWGNVNPVGPPAVYGEAKRVGAAMTMAYHRSPGLDTRIVRIFNTYGPSMRMNDGRAIPNFIRQALTGDPLTVYGDGSQTRSFTYIAALVDGIWRLMQ